MFAVAHRAANDLVLLQEACAAGIPVVEGDVHLSRGRLEMRHHKSMGRLPWLWDRWELRPRSEPGLLLPDVLDAVPPGTTLMLDVKGVGRTGSAAARLVRTRPEVPVIVAARWWRGTRPFTRQPAVTVVLSARSRVEVALLQARLVRRPVPDGVCVHLSQLTTRVVERLHSRVPLVMTWPVEDAAALARARQVGADAVIGQDLTLLRTVLAG